jgi:hypothetical protein
MDPESRRPGKEAPVKALARPERLLLDTYVSEDALRIHEIRDQAIRRWGGLILLAIALVVAAVAIGLSSDASKNSDRAWNLIFLIVGYAGAYVFRTASKRD